MFCSQCGKDNYEGAKFCINCGNPISVLTVTKENVSNTLGLWMLAIPLGASFLCWFWVGGMNSFESPGSKLNILMIGTILSTAVLAAIESFIFKKGNLVDSNKKSRLKAGPISWFFMISLLWVVGYPWYLGERKVYGLKNYFLIGVIITVIFTAMILLAGSTIEGGIDLQSIINAFEG